MNPEAEYDRTIALMQKIADLGKVTGLPIKGDVVAIQPEAQGQRADALIDIHIADFTQRYVVETKNNVDRYVMLGQLNNLFQNFNHPGLLWAPYVTPAIANRCRELEIAFLDDAGNAHLKAPGCFIFITGNKPQGPNVAPYPRENRPQEGGLLQDAAPPFQTHARQGGVTQTALRVVFALLCKPELLNAPYREIREAAEVALGAIGWVFFNLEGRGLTVGKQPNRHIADPIRLLDEWVINYPIKLRPKLEAWRFRAPEPEWWREADLQDVGGYWGGEVAAERLTGYIKPATQTIYLPPNKRREALARLVAKHRLQADHKGTLEVLTTFWNLPPEPTRPDLVHPVLVYADLVATADPRNLEVARMIRERFIDAALHQT